MKLSQLQEIQRDPNARWFSFTSGEEVEEDAIGEDFCILVGPATSRHSQRIARRETVRASGKADKRGELPIDVTLDIERKVAAEARAIDWVNLTGEDGEDVPFTPAAFRKAAEQFPELYQDVQMWSLQVAGEVAKARKAAEGNSPAGSGGS